MIQCNIPGHASGSRCTRAPGNQAGRGCKTPAGNWEGGPQRGGRGGRRGHTQGRGEAGQTLCQRRLDEKHRSCAATEPCWAVRGHRLFPSPPTAPRSLRRSQRRADLCSVGPGAAPPAAEQPGVGAPRTPSPPGAAPLSARPSHPDRFGPGGRFWTPAPRTAVSVTPARPASGFDCGRSGGRSGRSARRELGASWREDRPASLAESGRRKRGAGPRPRRHPCRLRGRSPALPGPSGPEITGSRGRGGVGAEGLGAEGVGAEGIGAEGLGAEGVGAGGFGAEGSR